MHLTIEKLINGDEEIIIYYQKSKEIWNNILDEIDINDVDKLAEQLTDKQLEFELNCGGQNLGQELMVVVGIAQFYSTDRGFENSLKKAKLVSEAFSISMCSLEVKYCAKEISRSYDLNDR